MSYGFGLSLRSARTVLENAIVTAAYYTSAYTSDFSVIYVRNRTVSVIVYLVRERDREETEYGVLRQ